MGVVKEKIKVYNMTCTSCEIRIEKSIRKLDGIHNVLVSHTSQQAIVEYDENICSNEKIKIAIKDAGYSVENPNTFKLVGILIIAAAIILLSVKTSNIDMNSKLKNPSYLMIFVVGILTSLHCIGMCGGIMLSQSISNEHKNKLHSINPSILYNLGRIISYTLLGAIVGALGSVFSLSIKATAGLQIIAGVFMIIMGLNMSGFSIFQKFNINILFPKMPIIKKPQAPFFIGMLNGLMPCGPLQTMQLYALGTGSALKGALSLFIFSLGTVPLMLSFGSISGLLNKVYTKTILKFSGIIIIILGLIMGNRGLNLTGISFPSVSFNNQNRTANSTKNLSDDNINIKNHTKPTLQNGVQVLTMSVATNGYSPDVLYVEKNKPVKWIINGSELNSCNSYLIVPDLNIQKQLNSGNNIIQFTPKDKDINFTCGMGMINGVIKVEDNLNFANPSNSD